MQCFIADKNRKLSKLATYHVEGLSYGTILKLLRKKDVKVNGKRVNQDVVLEIGDKVEIYCDIEKPLIYNEIYHDEQIVVINKKKGFSSEKVFERVKEQFEGARFIHRLDTNTDGIMIFALTESSEEELILGFKNHNFVKKYHATVVGVPKKQEQILSAYLFKDSKASKVTVSSTFKKGAVAIRTGYKVISSDNNTSLLEVTLYTGKTHQIRAHLSFIGHPIVGDGKYGDFKFNQTEKIDKQMLTAYSLTLVFNEQSPLYYLNGKTFKV